MTEITNRNMALPVDLTVRSADLNDLAQTALARLCAELRGKQTCDSARGVLGDPCAAAMAYALCDNDDAAASVIVEDLLNAGLSVEDVCIDHLAPAARRLGELWARDRLPFSDVTYATARIQSLLRRMPASRKAATRSDSTGALFAAVPGEEHTLGIVMATDLLRRNGWDVSLLVGLTHDELVSRFSRDDRAVIGLSCSGDHSYPALCRLLPAVSAARPDAHILLAGQIVQDADKLAGLAVPVTVVHDLAETEAELTSVAARRRQAKSQPDQANGRISSAA